MPFLKKITFDWNRVKEKNKYPFNIPALSQLNALDMNHNLIFFIGENGTGKSTLLEAIAFKCGFGNKGGGKNDLVENPDSSIMLEPIITLSWLPKVSNGFLLRAETFFDFANYLDQLAQDPYIGPQVYNQYGGKSLHEQSHGEAFLSLFSNRLRGKGLYILDEPEAALSPQRQMAFLRIMRDLEQSGHAQFLIATHSPILLAYPKAVIYSFAEDEIKRVAYEETEHYQLTKAFLNNRESFLKQLFEDY
ncbi:MAG: ATPase AAA [Peptococcaceae bacterium BRH_c8a]|nr:MAG: ATPase AAA [Peptococcaceae bacterium BRH_c8a]